jgi:ABC-type sugar transport system ATPase subunit
MVTSPPLLKISGIRKSFPGVEALKGVDLEVRVGEVHALVGENGAGKSTLMHIISGVYQPEAGNILFAGHPHSAIEDEHKAQGMGIDMVYQERSLFGSLSVAENIFAGNAPVHWLGAINRMQLLAKTRQLVQGLGLEIDPATRVHHLCPAEQQMVEIARALSRDARLLILDEPTSSLTGPEIHALFRIIEELRQKRVSVIYISHRLEEVFRIADRVTVLRDGECRGTFDVRGTSASQLISLMVGREIPTNANQQNDTIPSNVPIALEVRHLTDGTVVRDVSFAIRAGEIAAFAGLAGAGRTELALAIFGAAHRESGEILIKGQKVSVNSPHEAIAAGIGYVPEDRREAGLFLEMSVSANIVAAQLGYSGSKWADKRTEHNTAAEYCQRLNITTSDVTITVKHLSGGNQQRVLLARWLLVNPRVLIVDEPTRGVDVVGKAEIHKLLYGLARSGTAVMLISSELPEILAVADRILVMREGRITGELNPRQASEEEILRCAATRPNVQ